MFGIDLGGLMDSTAAFALAGDSLIMAWAIDLGKTSNWARSS